MQEVDREMRVHRSDILGRSVSHQLTTCHQLTPTLPATLGAFFLDAIAFPQVMTHG